jgi:hypothetical protein
VIDPEAARAVAATTAANVPGGAIEVVFILLVAATALAASSRWLRETGALRDEVFRRVERDLDLEELRMES